MCSTLPKLGKFSLKLDETMEYHRNYTVWLHEGKKKTAFSSEAFRNFFQLFLKYFSYVSHKNSVSGSIKLFSLLLGKQEPLGRCSYKTFPRHTFITRKMFFFSEKWFFRQKAEDIFRSSFFYCFLPLHLLNSGIIYFFGNKFISPWFW